ncbi:MAG: DUF1003 domain-containing protein [Pseudomonadota bacterium]
MRIFSKDKAPQGAPTAPAAPAAPDAQAVLPDQAAKNIGALMEYYVHEESKIGLSQQFIETLGNHIGRPVFPFLILGFVLLWTLANAVLVLAGKPAFDPAPYFYLQGILCLSALLTTTIVLIRQNRMAGLAEQRAHLDLRINMLTEQKAAKLIDLIEELRRDLPNVRNRADSQANEMGQSMNPQAVRAALDEHKETGAAIVAQKPE